MATYLESVLPVSFAAMLFWSTMFAVWLGLFRATAPDTVPDYPLARGVVVAVFALPIGGLPALVLFALAGGELA